MWLELFGLKQIHVQVSLNLGQHKLCGRVDQSDVLMKERLLITNAKELVDDLKHALQRVQHLVTYAECQIGNSIFLGLQLSKFCHCCDVTAN